LNSHHRRKRKAKKQHLREKLHRKGGPVTQQEYDDQQEYSEYQHLIHRTGRRVRVKGIAKDAFLGAVVLLSDGTPVYLDRMESWNPSILNTAVVVEAFCL